MSYMRSFWKREKDGLYYAWVELPDESEILLKQVEGVKLHLPKSKKDREDKFKGIFPEEAEEQPFATRNCDKGKCVHAGSYRDQLPCLECSHLDGLRPAIANIDRVRSHYLEGKP